MSKGPNFNVITLFPEMFLASDFQVGVTGQSRIKGLLNVQCVNPRQFATDAHQTVDDRPYGGGDGMVLMAEPLSQSLEQLKKKNQLGHVVYLSPQGSLWTDQRAREWAQTDGYKTLICGRYGGVDERFIHSYVREEISIGDFVLSGGELAALVIIDSVARFVEGVLGNADSRFHDSFSEGTLEAPLFTRPRKWRDQAVPDVLLSGDHGLIQRSRQIVGWLRTFLRRPDLLKPEGALEEQGAHKALDWIESNTDDQFLLWGLGPKEDIRKQLTEWLNRNV